MSEEIAAFHLNGLRARTLGRRWMTVPWELLERTDWQLMTSLHPCFLYKQKLAESFDWSRSCVAPELGHLGDEVKSDAIAQPWWVSYIPGSLKYFAYVYARLRIGPGLKKCRRPRNCCIKSAPRMAVARC